jgi:riboflavin synthase
MFTGIIEEVGKISKVSFTSRSVKLRISAGTVLSDLKPGDSISVEGVCLTATEVHPDGFSVDMVRESLVRTTLKTITAGDPVNLERAVRADGRLGGHMVSGHIDGVGRISLLRSTVRSVEMEVVCDRALLGRIVEKGSIAIDGISLTVASISSRGFKVALIPFTMRSTSLNRRRIGDFVNIELDAVGKYIEKHVTQDKKKAVIDDKFMLEAGYKI